MQLELFTTFNNHFVYNDDIIALGTGTYLKFKEEHDEEQENLVGSDPRDKYYKTCFDCGLSYSDTAEYQNEIWGD